MRNLRTYAPFAFRSAAWIGTSRSGPLAYRLLSEIRIMAFAHVLVPIDFGDAAEEAIEVATDFAAKFDSRITLLHVLFIAYPLAYANGFYVPMEDVMRQARGALANSLARAQMRHANTHAILTRGEPWRHIIHCVEERDVDLVVMGTHGRRTMSRFLLGSTAEKVVRLSPAPVLTVSPRYAKAEATTATVDISATVRTLAPDEHGLDAWAPEASALSRNV